MDIDVPLNANVMCTNGEGGHSVAAIVDPVKKQVTHVVVREKGLVGNERLVAVEMIQETKENTIYLRYSVAELKDLPPFVVAEYIPFQDPGLYSWPYFAPMGEPGGYVEHEAIPFAELAIRRGSRVAASDGAVGRVDEFLVNRSSDGISHLIMREGHLWGQRDVTIPVAQIERIEDGDVFLKLTKAEVAALPVVPVKR